MSRSHLRRGSLPSTSASSASPAQNPLQRQTRMNKRRNASPGEEPEHNLDPLEKIFEKEHEEKTKVKNITEIQFGEYLVQTWYYSPFPEGYREQSRLYVCAFCLKYMKKPKTLAKHKLECKLRHPPGTEIYRNETIAMFEVCASFKD